MEFSITFSQAKTYVDEFVSYMQTQGYKKSTQKVTANNIRFFLNSAKDEHQLLTEKTIFDFVNKHYDLSLQHSRYNSMLGSCRRFLFYLCDGNFDRPRSIPIVVSLSEELTKYIDEFIGEFSSKNCEFTILIKHRAISKFAVYLSGNGINTFTELDTAIVLAYLQSKTPETRAFIRSFLHFLFVKNVIKRDLSVLIHITKRPNKLPSVYSEKELTELISVYDGNDLIAKRNKAIILIAATTGLRSCDIINLKYSDFCFDRGYLHVVQSKTGVSIFLPINEETASAVISYYISRPNSKYTNLFINQNAPFTPISTGIIRYILRKAFVASGIDTTGKKHGPHSLRSSLASAMVNSGLPYEIVQRQLGHTSDDSLNRYVRLDIEKLRLCSLTPLPATGNFKQWLEGNK